ncbi:hypothetical protein ACI8AG_09170 [Blastococcus sp. SYSU DS0552]
MAKHAIVGYSIHLEGRWVRGQKPRHLLAPMPTGDDMLMFISGFFESLRGNVGAAKDHHFGETTDIQRLGRTIGARMNAGRSGLETDINDPLHPEEGTFRRQKRHVENIAVRQLVVIPEGSKTGYWLFESVGGRSLGTGYRTQFKRDFVARYPKLQPVFEPIVLEEAWDTYTDNEEALVEQVRIVRSHANPDQMESMGIGDVNGRYIQVLEAETPTRTKRVFGGLRDRYFRRTDEGRWVPRDPEVTEVSAKVLVEGKERTVVVDREDPVKMRIELDTSKDEAPSDSYFYSEARDWVVDLAERDDVTLPADWRSGEWTHDSDYGQLGAQDGTSPAGSADQQDPDDGADQDAPGNAE